jgi:hypothetical protein
MRIIFSFVVIAVLGGVACTNDYSSLRFATESSSAGAAGTSATGGTAGAAGAAGTSGTAGAGSGP